MSQILLNKSQFLQLKKIMNLQAEFELHLQLLF